MAAQSSVDSCAAMPGGGRCGVRTRDPFGVNEVRYHCANRPRWRNYARSGGACPGRRATIRRHQCRGSRRSSNHLMTSDTPVSGDRGSDTSSCNARWQRTRSATRSPPCPSTAFPGRTPLPARSPHTVTWINIRPGPMWSTSNRSRIATRQWITLMKLHSD